MLRDPGSPEIAFGCGMIFIAVFYLLIKYILRNVDFKEKTKNGTFLIEDLIVFLLILGLRKRFLSKNRFF